MTLTGTTRKSARAVVEGLLSALADGMDAFVEQGLAVEKILLIGGGAASVAVQQIAPETIFGQDVCGFPNPVSMWPMALRVRQRGLHSANSRRGRFQCAQGLGGVSVGDS